MIPTGAPNLTKAEQRVVRRAFLVGLAVGLVFDVSAVVVGLV